MCVVSNIYDYGRQQIEQQWPWVTPSIESVPPEVTKEDIAEIRRELAELRDLIKAGQRYDEATGQPDCELEEKTELIRRLAELLDVEIN